MNQNIQSISIKKPCHENWDGMADTDYGKFCNSCQKNVVDFTVLSNTQILNYLGNRNNLCGKFGEKQLLDLNQQLSEQAAYTFSWKKLSIAATLISVFHVIRAEAKTNIQKQATSKEFNSALNNTDTLRRRKKADKLVCKSYTPSQIKLDLTISPVNSITTAIPEQTALQAITVGGVYVVQRRSFVNRIFYAIGHPGKTIFRYRY